MNRIIKFVIGRIMALTGLLFYFIAVGVVAIVMILVLVLIFRIID